MSDILIGTDIEFPCIKDGKYIAAGLVGCNGRKGKPVQIGTGGVEVDCVSLELTMPPASTAADFEKRLLAHHANTAAHYDVQMPIVDSRFYSPDELDAPYANEFGCEPDVNVYTQLPQFPRPREDGLRTFGGHIHIGGDMDRDLMVVSMDYHVALWAIANRIEAPTNRRALYGKAGSHRAKPYGIEYRVLGNGWFLYSAALFERVVIAHKYHMEIDNILAERNLTDNDLQIIINDCLVDEAQDIIGVSGALKVA